MPRAAERQDDTDQGGNEARPKVMALDVSERGVHGGLRDAPHSQAWESTNWRRRMGIEPTGPFLTQEAFIFSDVSTLLDMLDKGERYTKVLYHVERSQTYSQTQLDMLLHRPRR